MTGRLLFCCISMIVAAGIWAICMVCRPASTPIHDVDERDRSTE